MLELPECLRIGNLLVIPDRGIIAGSDSVENLTDAQLNLLLQFVTKPGEAVTFGDLCNATDCDQESLSRRLAALKAALGDVDKNARFLLVKKDTATLVAPVHSGPGQHGALLEQLLKEDSGLSFFQQLLRRKVIRTGAAYVVLAWVAIQVADTVMPRVGLPSWAVTLTIAIAMLGFPVAIVVAWLFEATAIGTLRDNRRTPAPLSGKQKLVDVAVLASLAVVVGYLAIGVIGDVRSDRERSSLISDTGRVLVAANTVAVLPFRLLGSDPSKSYIGDGIAEEILRLLSRLQELNVSARTASFFFKDKNVDMQVMAEKLQVRHLLSGSVQIVGSSIRVNAELVDASTGYQLWSESFDREMDDVFAIQSEIARAVADQSQVVLSEESEAQLDARPTSSLEAYDFYLRGRDYLNQPRTVATLADARRLFHRALALDPDYALARSGLCETHLATYIRTKSPTTVDDAESECRAALEMDDSLPEVHNSLGILYWNLGDFDRAETEFRTAIQKNSRFYEAYAGLGDTLYSKKQLDEALLAYQQLVELQPAFWRGYQRLGAYYYRQGRDAEALTYFNQVTDLSPDNAPGWNNVGAVNYMLGNLETAANAWQRSLDLAPAQSTLANLGTMYYYLGRFEDAVEMQRQAVETAPDDYRAWGRLAAAYNEMEQREAEANAAYTRGIRLAEEGLAINPNDADAVKNIALFHAHLGNDAVAAQAIEKSLSLSPQDPDAYFFAALAHLEMGDERASVSALEQAVKLGYSTKLIASEPALAQLHGSDRFNLLINTNAATEPL